MEDLRGRGYEACKRDLRYPVCLGLQVCLSTVSIPVKQSFKEYVMPIVDSVFWSPSDVSAVVSLLARLVRVSLDAPMEKKLANQLGWLKEEDLNIAELTPLNKRAIVAAFNPERKLILARVEMHEYGTCYGLLRNLTVLR